jgi:hypothetical protein
MAIDAYIGDSHRNPERGNIQMIMYEPLDPNELAEARCSSETLHAVHCVLTESLSQSPWHIWHLFSLEQVGVRNRSVVEVG